MPKKGQSGRRGRTNAQYAEMERTGWRSSPDPAVKARRNQRFRLRQKAHAVTLTQADVDLLVAAYLRNRKVTRCPVGWALGAHRDGIDILVNG